jgi:hypothetical protein
MMWTDVSQAVAAVVGAVATPVAVIIPAKSPGYQRDRSDAEEIRRRRVQARCVGVQTVVTDLPRIDGEGKYWTRVATVTNSSSEPIHELELHWQVGDSDGHRHADNRVSLMPGEVWQQPEPIHLLHGDQSRPVETLLYFLDSEERGWFKGANGEC